MRENFKPLKTTGEKTLNHLKRQTIFSWLFLTFDGPEKDRFCDVSLLVLRWKAFILNHCFAPSRHALHKVAKFFRCNNVMPGLNNILDQLSLVGWLIFGNDYVNFVP